MIFSPLTLVIDTASSSGLVALGQGTVILASEQLNAGKGMSERLLPGIHKTFLDSDRLLEEINLIAVTQGPGSFTGLRVGLATAKGLSYTGKVPVVGFNSLEILALGQEQEHRPIIAALPARPGWIYSATYQSLKNQGWSCIEEPAIFPMDDWIGSLGNDPCLVGQGVRDQEELISKVWPDSHISKEVKDHQPSASVLLKRGMELYQQSGGVPPESLSPLYLQPSVAELNFEKKRMKENN